MDIQVNAVPVLHNMVLVWISVIILYFILRHFLYKPVTEFLKRRKELINETIDSAKKEREEARLLKEGYEQKIADAKKEGAEIVEGYRKRGEEIRQKLINDAHNEVKLMKQGTEREIKRQKDAAYEDIKSQSAEMALLIAEKLMKDSLDEDRQSALIEGIMNEMEGKSWRPS